MPQIYTGRLSTSLSHYAARLREIFFPSSVYVSLSLFLPLTPLGLGRKDLVGLLLCGILEELEEHHLLQQDSRWWKRRRRSEKKRGGGSTRKGEGGKYLQLRASQPADDHRLHPHQQLLAASKLESTCWSWARLIGLVYCTKPLPVGQRSACCRALLHHTQIPSCPYVLFILYHHIPRTVASSKGKKTENIEKREKKGKKI